MRLFHREAFKRCKRRLNAAGCVGNPDSAHAEF